MEDKNIQPNTCTICGNTEFVKQLLLFGGEETVCAKCFTPVKEENEIKTLHK